MHKAQFVPTGEKTAIDVEKTIDCLPCCGRVVIEIVDSIIEGNLPVQAHTEAGKEQALVTRAIGVLSGMRLALSHAEPREAAIASQMLAFAFAEANLIVSESHEPEELDEPIAYKLADGKIGDTKEPSR